MKTLKIIPQCFYTCSGKIRSFGILLDNKPYGQIIIKEVKKDGKRNR